MERKKDSAASLTKQSSATAAPLKRSTSNDRCDSRSLALSMFHLQRNADMDHGRSVSAPAEAAMRDFGQSPEGFLGVVGRCALDGCDVHLLTLDGEVILRHYQEGEGLPDMFESARLRIADEPMHVVAILVFERHIEVLRLDGSTAA